MFTILWVTTKRELQINLLQKWDKAYNILLFAVCYVWCNVWFIKSNQTNKQTNNPCLHFEQSEHPPPKKKKNLPQRRGLPLVWEAPSSSSRISQASCPQRPWALNTDIRRDPRVVTIRDPEGIWTALCMSVCVLFIQLDNCWACIDFASGVLCTSVCVLVWSILSGG